MIADRVATSVNTVLAIAKRFDENSGDVLATIGANRARRRRWRRL